MDGFGHNNPPAHIIAQLEAEAFAERCKALVVTTAADLTTAAELIDAEVRARKAAEKQRTTEKQPHLDAGRAVDAAWQPVTATLDAAIRPVKAQVLAFQQAERKRIAAEQEAARLEAERAQEAAIAALQSQEVAPWEAEALVEQADTAAAAVAAVEAASSQTTTIKADGVRARSIKLVWSVEVTDPAALVRALAGNAEVQAAAEKVANAMARAMKQSLALDGCKPVSRETL